MNKLLLIPLLGALTGCVGNVHHGSIEQAHTTAHHCNGDVSRSADYVIFDTEGESSRQEVTATCEPATATPEFVKPMKVSGL